MISVKQNGEVYEITFRYDPEVIALVKNVPGRSWVASAKMWTIPKHKLGFLLNQFKGTQYESSVNVISDEAFNVNASLDATDSIPEVDLSGVPFYVKAGSSLYDHQVDFMKYALHRQHIGNNSGFILADDPGLGKTIECMNLAMYNKLNKGFKHCLIVCCINSSKYNWYEDIVKHTNGEEVPYILGTRFRRDKIHTRSDTGSSEKLKDLVTGHMYGDTSAPELPYFLIVNIEAFRAKEGKQYVFTNEILRWINDGKINMIGVDEIHKNASPTSMQGKQLLEIKKRSVRPVMWMPMTGTPIVSKPTDVFTPLKLVDGHNYSSYYMWCRQFCVYGGFSDHDIIGYKNIPTLKSMLQDNMLRRRKEDVLDLPPIVSYTTYVENTPYQQRLYKSIVSEIRSERAEILSSLNPLAKLLKLRQVNGSPELVDQNVRIDKTYLSKNAKLKELLSLLDDIVARGEKVIVFSNWVEPLRTLYRFISSKYKTCYYTGTMSSEAREDNKRIFIEDPSYPIMIGTIGALGTSHTLTVARNVIFYDEPWTYADKKQAWERIYRIGTTASVNVYTLISKDTVDDRVHDIVYTKEGLSNYIVDGQIDLRSNPKLFDILLGDII